VNFGGWNVRSCFHTYKQQLITKQLSRYNIQVAALYETGIYHSGVKTVCDDWTMIYSGLPSQSKTRAAHGVAVCLNKTATAAWKNSGSEWEPVSERILRVRIHCSPINITLIAVYAPVNPSNRSMNDNSDTFYADLQETADRVQQGDMLLIVGDLNARLGEQEHLTAPRCVGSFTADVQNANGVKGPPGQKSIFFPEHPILMKFLLNMYLTLHSLQ
jgi:exonuclease III